METLQHYYVSIIKIYIDCVIDRKSIVTIYELCFIKMILCKYRIILGLPLLYGTLKFQSIELFRKLLLWFIKFNINLVVEISNFRKIIDPIHFFDRSKG